MSATSDFPQTFRGKDGNLTDRPRIGDTAVSLAPDGKTVLEETPVTAQFLREHRKGENRKNSGDPYYHQRRSGGRAAQYHGRPHIDEQRAARKAEQNKMLGDFDATMQTAADAGYRPLGNPTERLASRNLNDRDKQDVLNEGRRLAAATDASQVTERPKGATPEETAKLDREFDKQEVIRDGRLVQRGVADREAASRATREEARKNINENRVTAAKQRVQDDVVKQAENKQRMDRIQSATPSAPHVLRDKNGNAVGYSYRGQKPPEGATKEQVAATRKTEADTARATKIDGVAASDAVAIGSRTNADERFDAQHGTKQAQLGGGSYQDRITREKKHNETMAGHANVREHLKNNSQQMEAAASVKQQAQRNVAAGSALDNPLTMTGTASPPPDSPLKEHRIPMSERFVARTTQTHQNSMPAGDGVRPIRSTGVAGTNPPENSVMSLGRDDLTGQLWNPDKAQEIKERTGRYPPSIPAKQPKSKNRFTPGGRPIPDRA
jgi:hypothetical protein